MVNQSKVACFYSEQGFGFPLLHYVLSSEKYNSTKFVVNSHEEDCGYMTVGKGSITGPGLSSVKSYQRWLTCR